MERLSLSRNYFLRPLPFLPPVFPSLTASPFLDRTPSLLFDFCPKSLSNVFPERPDTLRFFGDLTSFRSGTPIFAGRAAFFAERIAALSDLLPPSSLSSSIVIFRRLAFRDRPESLFRLG